MKNKIYTITFCRRSRFYTPNKKGCFTKEFNTLNGVVKFLVNANDNLRCPKIKEELTKREFMILLNKLNSQLMLSN